VLGFFLSGKYKSESFIGALKEDLPLNYFSNYYEEHLSESKLFCESKYQMTKLSIKNRSDKKEKLILNSHFRKDKFIFHSLTEYNFANSQFYLDEQSLNLMCVDIKKQRHSTPLFIASPFLYTGSFSKIQINKTTEKIPLGDSSVRSFFNNQIYYICENDIKNIKIDHKKRIRKITNPSLIIKLLIKNNLLPTKFYGIDNFLKIAFSTSSQFSLKDFQFPYNQYSV